MSLTSDQFSPEIGSNYYPDRWIALSSLQKSIRRGAVEPATAAAEVLWSERSRLLDRLLVIGLEDIGVGDPEVLREVIELTTDRTWRRKLPDKGRAVTLGLVERMPLAYVSKVSGIPTQLVKDRPFETWRGVGGPLIGGDRLLARFMQWRP